MLEGVPRALHSVRLGNTTGRVAVILSTHYRPHLRYRRAVQSILQLPQADLETILALLLQPAPSFEDLQFLYSKLPANATPHFAGALEVTIVAWVHLSVWK